jgi:hypothetical protein
LNWAGLFTLGAVYAGLTVFLVFGADWIFGGEHAPSRQFLAQVGKSNKVGFVFRLLRFGRAS